MPESALETVETSSKKLDTPDPVVRQRIQEETAYLKEQIDGTDELIREKEIELAKSASGTQATSLANRLFRRTRKPAETAVDPALHKLKLNKADLAYQLEDAPRRIEGRIGQNRRSLHLYDLRNFLGDPIDLNGRKAPFEFPFDGGRKDCGNDYKLRQRRFDNGQKLLVRAKQALQKSDGKIVLYDTSDPYPQARHEIIIDVLTELGVAGDESLKRGFAVLDADTGLNPDAMDDFTQRSPHRPAHRLLIDDWIHTSDDRSTARGYLLLEGHQNAPKAEESLGEQVIKKGSVSQLCDKWDIPHLYAELIYDRTSTDTRLTLELHEQLNIIDANRDSTAHAKITHD